MNSVATPKKRTRGHGNRKNDSELHRQRATRQSAFAGAWIRFVITEIRNPVESHCGTSCSDHGTNDPGQLPAGRQPLSRQQCPYKCKGKGEYGVLERNHVEGYL